MKFLTKFNIKKGLLILILLASSLWIYNKVASPKSIVTFIVNGEKYAVISYNENKLILPDNPIFIGYEFKGWYIDKEYITEFDNNTVEVRFVYAKMQGLLHQITLDANGGSLDYALQFMIKNYDVITLPMPTLYRYSFMGWYHEDILIDSDVLITKNLNLVARWEVTHYELILNPNGGYLEENFFLIKAFTKIEVLPIPVKQGHIFLGWYMVIKGNVSDISFNEKIIPQMNIFLVAKWLD